MTLSPDAVYLADYADGLVTLLSGLESRGYDGKILTTSSIASAEVFSEAGGAAEGVLFTQSNYDVDAEDERVQQFVQAYREKYGSAPDLYAAHGYDAMRIYARALQEGGRRPSQFWQGMRGISGFPGVTGAIQFDEQGDVQKFPRVYIIQEGQFVDYDKVLEERRRALDERRRALERRMRELERQRRALDEGGGEG
jgi:branched-chain amino acid transport system substrate-binding protein